jgi:outer membrane protein OmpA-like peptidoglycan-associated protein
VRLQPAKVYIDGKLATGITVSKDGKTLIMTVPAHAAGKVDITVTTKDGSFTFPQSYEYIPGGNTSKGFVIFGGDSSVLTAAGKASLDKLNKGIPKGAVIASVGINGWVHRTASTKIDAALSIARATVSANYLKSKGVKGIDTLDGKGIYHLGNDQDRRAEIEIVWTNSVG